MSTSAIENHPKRSNPENKRGRLFLNRKVSESIIVDYQGSIIRITVLGIKGQQVKLSIDADQKIPVHRIEIYKRILESQGKSFDETA